MKLEDRFLARGKVIEVSFKRDLPPFSFCGNTISREKLDEIKVIKKTNNWEQGFVCPPCGYEGVTIVSPDGWRKYEIDPATLCQCTGIKDKNGKLIFEGDIVKLRCDVLKKEYVCEIKWEGHLCVSYGDNEHGYAVKEPLSVLLESIEIIGNRFDNPELLEDV